MHIHINQLSFDLFIKLQLNLWLSVLMFTYGESLSYEMPVITRHSHVFYNLDFCKVHPIHFLHCKKENLSVSIEYNEPILPTLNRFHLKIPPQLPKDKFPKVLTYRSCLVNLLPSYFEYNTK